MNKFILLSFLLTVLAVNTDATVKPFGCWYTDQGTGTGDIKSSPHCVTACYRVTATGGIPTGANDPNKMAANSINGVITTLVGSQALTTLANQKALVNGVGIQSKIGVKPNDAAGTSSGATDGGVQTLGNIGIITLPEVSDPNGLKDFKLNDKGCLPILALQTAPVATALRATNPSATGLASNAIAYSIGRTCASVSDNGQCLTPATCTFGTLTAGCLSGMAGGNGADFNTALGANTAGKTSGTAAISGTTHIKQQTPTASFGGVPLQLAYNPIIGGDQTGSPPANGGAITVPASGGTDVLWTNLLANTQINQVALDLAAVTTLFCVTSGVCCTTDYCNAQPVVVAVKSSSTSLNNNIIIILMSIICSMSF